MSRLMVALAWLALGTAVACALGAVGYRTTQTISTLLGPLPMVIGVPTAYIRMRRGDRSMGYLFAGWALYAIGVAVMAALLRGMVPFNVWTRHAFQIGFVSEMTLWLVLLGRRVQEMHRAGEEARRKQDALRSMALTDALTGLTNRRGLEPVLAAAVRDCRPDRRAAVFMMDVDGFKKVNDQFGYEVGDRLLVAIAARLSEGVRRSDCACRLGGDEFVVVAEGFRTDSDVLQFGQKLLAALARPLDLTDAPGCRVGVTIGYAVAPADGVDGPALLRSADAAMYAGKRGGKGCLRRASSATDSEASDDCVSRSAAIGPST
jgi:diguanylate cyclase (GGDEF)-like protein